MKKEVLYSLKGIYRENFEIEGYRFGHGEKSACIVGAMRGNEIQQLYICSQLIKVLKDLEMRGAISHNHEILVIPSANRFSMNVEKRFWPVDNTDINRMFPGDEAGDTTKQIAAAIFESSKGYSYGIQFASFYMPGDFIPHVRMMETGYQSASLANLFGLQYVVIRKPKPMDTATLNYSWQMNGTNAFSIYTNSTDIVDEKSARQAVSSVLRFLTRMGILKYNNHSGYIASVINEYDLSALPCGGGSLTALPIIETQAGDVSAYIPTNVISITDGQIYLETEMFNSGFRPAINAGLSVSRVGGSAQIKAIKKIAAPIRTELAQYRELASFSQFGSELDADTKETLAQGERIREMLKQPQYKTLEVEKEVVILYAVTNKYLDDVPVEKIADFERGFFEFMEQNHNNILIEIKETGVMSDKATEELKSAIESFKAKFE